MIHFCCYCKCVPVFKIFTNSIVQMSFPVPVARSLTMYWNFSFARHAKLGAVSTTTMLQVLCVTRWKVHLTKLGRSQHVANWKNNISGSIAVSSLYQLYRCTMFISSSPCTIVCSIARIHLAIISPHIIRRNTESAC